SITVSTAHETPQKHRRFGGSSKGVLRRGIFEMKNSGSGRNRAKAGVRDVGITVRGKDAIDARVCRATTPAAVCPPANSSALIRMKALLRTGVNDRPPARLAHHRCPRPATAHRGLQA